MLALDVHPLRFIAGQPRVRLRELTGADERAVNGTATDDALRLLDALLVALPGDPAPPRAEELVAADRDRLLVAVYQHAFGDRIENTLTCMECRSPFDIDFALSALTSSLEQTAEQARVRRLGENVFETGAGVRFRLPTGRDERAMASLPLADAERGLLQRCLLEGETAEPRGRRRARPKARRTAPAENATEDAANELQDLLAEVAPLLDLELDARCPECRHEHALQFDIQTYLLGAILGERPRLALEVHRIAVAYGWSLHEILSLTRRERRQYLELIDNDAAARARRYLG